MKRKSRVIAILILTAGLCTSAAAQDEDEASPRWSGDASLGMALARGNTETTNISASFSTKGLLSDRHEWINSGLFLIGRAGGETNAESLQVGTRVNWNHTDRFFSFYEIQGIRDRFKNYSYRILPGAGIGFQLLTDERASISLNSGLSQVFTKYRDSGDTDSYTGWTVGNQLSWKLSANAEFTQMLSLNTDVSELSHYFLRFEANLISALSQGFSVKLSLIDIYDNNPVGDDIKKNDVAFVAGLSLKF